MIRARLAQTVPAALLAADVHCRQVTVQTMLRSGFPAPPDCYLYGPVCVADWTRPEGEASAKFNPLLP